MDIPGSVEEEQVVEEPLAASKYTGKEVIPAEPEEDAFAEGYTPSSDEESIEQPRRRGFSPPSREQLLTWAPFWGVILLRGILRFWRLGDKPLHHDERLHAYFSLQLLHNIEGWINCFNPSYS